MYNCFPGIQLYTPKLGAGGKGKGEGEGGRQQKISTGFISILWKAATGFTQPKDLLK